MKLSKPALVLLVAAWGTVALAAQGPGNSPRASKALDSTTAALLQGDAHGALKALQRVPTAEFGPQDASVRACIAERLGGAAPPRRPVPVHDAFTRAVVEAYRTYWWQALRHTAPLPELETRLLDRLRGLLGADAAEAADFDALAAALVARLRAAGYHALPPGRTPPLQDMMIWRRQTSSVERVALPEGEQPVRLELLDDFVLRGWSDDASCGLTGAGGWATEDAIYAIRPAYPDLGSETFRVSLLGHEAQHFADYRRWPGLPSTALEYRAKLAELSLADETQPVLLHKFAAAQGDDEAAPHLHANRRVLQALRARLGVKGDLRDVPRAAVREAARAMLKDDSAQRSSMAAR